MRRLAPLFFSCALCGCANIPTAIEEPAIYHYLRTNRDSSEPEHVVQFRPDPSHIAVYKWVSKCANAAYVTADFDPSAGEATALDAGRVAKDGSQEKFGRIALDREARSLELWIDTPDGRVSETVEGVGQPWALFDYDLADLNAVFQSRPPKGDFAFWWALVWPGSGNDGMIRKPGWVDGRDRGLVERDGRTVRHFVLTLRANPSVKGNLWLDPGKGYIGAADFDLPNHDNYHDFAMRLERVEAGGEAAWHRLLAAHYSDCPAEE